MKKQMLYYQSEKRNERIKRALACLLALLLTVAALPPALPVISAQTAAYTQPAAPTEGDCGSAAIWHFDPASGTLTVSGTGVMQDYSTAHLLEAGRSVTTAPWRPFYHEIRTVVIDEGVTGIGNAAFLGCDSLTRVTIASSVSRIGSSAFGSCTALPTIAIPPGVTAVELFAFSGCTGLTSVQISDLAAWCRISFTGAPANPLSCAHRLILNGEPLTELTIPESVTSIGNYKFYGCEDLTRVTIPPSVTSIGHYALMGCTGLSELALPDSVTSIGQNAFSDCTGLTSVSLGAGVASIAGLSFSGCTGLTAVPAGSSVTSIESSAFADCTGLIAIAVPEGVTRIGNGAFSGCSGAKSISIPAGVTAIEDRAFSGCVNVTEITVAAGNPVFHSAGNCIIRTARNALIAGCRSSVIPADGSVTSIGYKAFEHCASLTGVTIPEAVNVINPYAFAGCTGLTEISIPASVADLGGSAFEGCTGLTEISIGRSVTTLSGNVFSGCTGLTSVTIPDSVTAIGGGAFRGCTALTAVSIPDSVISLGDDAFCDCAALAEMTLPGGITAIGREAFRGCTALRRVFIPDSVTSIGEGAFLDCAALTDVTLPDSVISIGDGAFLGCAALTDVMIPGSVTSIGPAAFGGCNALTSLAVAQGNPVYHSAGNCVIHTKDKTLIQGCCTSVIPDDGSVTALGSRSFFNIASLTETAFPACLQRIGASAFAGCTGLTGITFSEEIGSVWIGDYAFFGCAALTQIRLPRGAWTTAGLGRYMFADCTALTSVDFEANPVRIPSHAFENCMSLTHIALPDTVRTIEESAFQGCTGLTSVTIPSAVTLIETGAFFGCSALTEVAYGGTAQKWNAMTIRESNDPLFAAAVQFSDTLYTVTFLVNGEAVHTASLHAGDRIAAPAEPEVAGYSFDEWSPAVPRTMPERDLTFTAVLEPITYYAIFVADGVQIGEKIPYTVESTDVTPPAVPEKPGYTGVWEPYALTAGGITVHAVYTELIPPTVYIRNYAATRSVDYKTTMIFTAITDNAPAGATVHWFVDGRDAGTGITFKKESVSADFTVQAKLMDTDGRALAVSGVETVKVNRGFFARLAAFIRSLFGRLPVISQLIKERV